MLSMLCTVVLRLLIPPLADLGVLTSLAATCLVGGACRRWFSNNPELVKLRVET